MRLVCQELIGVMSWAACQSIWWSLMWECLTIDDFLKSPLRPCARCSLSLVWRFHPVSPMYTLPHSQGIRYTPALLLGSGLSLFVCVCVSFAGIGVVDLDACFWSIHWSLCDIEPK